MEFGPNSSVIVLLNFSGTVDVDPSGAVYQINSQGQTDFCLLRLQANGTLLWANTFGGTGDDYGAALKLDASGNINIAGAFSSTFDFEPGPGAIAVAAFGQKDAFFARYDINGNYLLHKVFGGFYNDEITDLHLTDSGNFLITGSYEGSVDFDPGSGQNYLGSFNGLTDMFVSCFDPSFNFIWVKVFGGSGITKSVKLAADDQNNIYLCGYYSGLADFDPSPAPLFFPAGGISTFIIRLDPNGNLLRLGFLNTQSQCFPLDLACGPNATLSLCGRFNGIIDLNPDTSVQSLVSGSNQGDDAFMLLLDSNLNLLWHKTIVSSFADAVTSTTFFPDSDIVFTGYFRGIYDFLDGPSYSIAGEINESAAFILKINQAGSLISVKDFATGAAFPDEIAVSPLGLFILSGNFSGNVNMAPDTGSIPISGNNFDQLFLSRFSLCQNLSLPDSISGDTSLCSGSIAQFLSHGCTNPVWFFPDGWNISSHDTLMNLPAGNASGWVRVASSDACGIGPALAIPVYTTIVDNNIQNTSGALWSTNFNASSFQWLDCNNAYQPVPGASYPLFWPTVPGSYAVLLQQGQCADTSSCETVLITGISEQPPPRFFYPNPFSSLTQISLSEPYSNLKVFNSKGMLVHISSFFSGETLSLNFSGQAAGFYHVELTLHSGLIIRQALMYNSVNSSLWSE